MLAGQVVAQEVVAGRGAINTRLFFCTARPGRDAAAPCGAGRGLGACDAAMPGNPKAAHTSTGEAPAQVAMPRKKAVAMKRNEGPEG